MAEMAEEIRDKGEGLYKKKVQSREEHLGEK